MEEVVKLLSDLIAFDTVSPEGKQYYEFVKYLKSWLEERGVKAEIVKVDEEYQAKHCPKGSRRYILFAQTEGEKVVEFNGHYDVVPPGEGWEGDPFKAKLVDNKLYGRGATDMKGGVASIAIALTKLKEGAQAVFVPDEEIGGACGTGYRVEVLKERYPIPPKVVIAEPSGGTVWIGHKGLVWVFVKVKGKQVHSSTPWLGENAFLKASSLALYLDQRLKGLFSKKPSKFEYTSGHPLAKFNTVNIGGFAESSSRKANTVPGTFTFSIDVRVIPEEKASEIANLILNELPPYAEGRVEELMEPFINENSELAKIIKEKWGNEERVCEGGLDLRYYRGYDAVSYGPGSPAQAHVPNEWIDVREVEEYAKRYVELVKVLLGK